MIREMSSDEKVAQVGVVRFSSYNCRAHRATNALSQIVLRCRSTSLTHDTYLYSGSVFLDFTGRLAAGRTSTVVDMDDGGTVAVNFLLDSLGDLMTRSCTVLAQRRRMQTRYIL